LWWIQGHYGEVLKGQYTNEDGHVQDVAIKRLKQTMYEKFAREFEKEFRIMIQLQHPNIVRIIGQSVERKLTVSQSSGIIVAGLLTGGGEFHCGGVPSAPTDNI